MDPKEIASDHVERVQTHGELDAFGESADEDYVLSKATIISVVALGWGFAAQTAQLTTSTTLIHQVAAVGGDAVSSWIPNAQNVVTFGTVAIMGSLSDHFGKRNMILIGLVVGFIGSVIAGRANHIGYIILGQGFLGLSGSFVSLTNPAVQEIVPNKKRPLTSVCFAAFLLVFNMVCTLAFAACIENDVTGAMNGWRWTYYLPAIFAFLGFIGVAIFYHPPPPRMRRGKTNMQVLKELDLLGMFLILAGMILIAVALNWGGSTYPWVSAHVLGCLFVGFVTVAAFGMWEWKGTSTGLLHHRLFSITRNFQLILAISLIDGMVLYGAAAYLPQEVAAVFSTNPIFQSLPLVFSTITNSIGGGGASLFLYFFKKYRLVLGAGTVWMGIWFGIMAFITPDRRWLTYLCPLMYSLGLGMTTFMPNLIMAYSVPSDLIGSALTIAQTVRVLGGVIGVTIFSSVLGNKEPGNFAAYVTPEAIMAGLPSSSVAALIGAIEDGLTGTELFSVTGVTSAVVSAIDPAIKMAYCESYKWVYITVAPFGALAGFLCYFLQPVAARMTDHVEAKLEKAPHADDVKLAEQY